MRISPSLPGRLLARLLIALSLLTFTVVPAVAISGCGGDDDDGDDIEVIEQDDSDQDDIGGQDDDNDGGGFDQDDDADDVQDAGDTD